MALTWPAQVVDGYVDAAFVAFVLVEVSVVAVVWAAIGFGKDLYCS